MTVEHECVVGSTLLAQFDGERVAILKDNLTFGQARWLAVWILAVTHDRNLRQVLVHFTSNEVKANEL